MTRPFRAALTAGLPRRSPFTVPLRPMPKGTHASSGPPDVRHAQSRTGRSPDAGLAASACGGFASGRRPAAIVANCRLRMLLVLTATWDDAIGHERCPSARTAGTDPRSDPGRVGHHVSHGRSCRTTAAAVGFRSVSPLGHQESPYLTGPLSEVLEGVGFLLVGEFEAEASGCRRGITPLDWYYDGTIRPWR